MKYLFFFLILNFSIIVSNADSNPSNPITIRNAHKKWIYCLVGLKDGTLASGSDDKKIKIWNTKTGSLIRELNGHNDSVTSLAALENGNLASGSYDRLIKIWNPKTGLLIKTLENENNWISCLASLSNQRIASCSGKNILIRNTTTGELIFKLKGHKYDVQYLSSQKELKKEILISATFDKTTKQWDPTLSNLNIFENLFRKLKDLDDSYKTYSSHPQMIQPLAFLHMTGSDMFYANATFNEINIWLKGIHILVRTLRGHEKSVVCMAELDYGRLVSSSTDQTIKIWNLFTKNSSNKNLMLSRIANIDNVYANLKAYQIIESNSSVLVELNNGAFATAEDKIIKLWNSNLTKTLVGHSDSVISLIVLPDGSLASGSADRTIKVWNPESGYLMRTIDQGLKVPCLDFFQNNLLASCSLGNLKIWDLKDPEFPVSSLVGGGDVYSLLKLEGNKLVGACSDRKIRIWPNRPWLKNRMRINVDFRYIIEDSIATFSDVLGLNQPIAVLKDGRIASCKGNEIKILNAFNGDSLRTLRGHNGDVRSITVLNDKMLLSVSDDKSIKLWNYKNGQFVKTLTKNNEMVKQFFIFRDGRLASFSKDKKIMIYDKKQFFDFLE